MEWYREVQFVSAVPMPPEMASEFGTTVNGMWASPEVEAAEVRDLHQRGRRVLFSVPLIALVPRDYEAPGLGYLLEETCLDLGGRPSECDWYYWERKPVYAACIYSDAFRAHLLDRCKLGIDRGADVVNLDEIMTSVGLMSRAPRMTGFCPRCLERFRAHVRERGDAELGAIDDAALLDRLWKDDALFDAYRAFHDREAFRVMTAFIAELRAHAASTNPGFAITANVAYLGSFVERFGTLWGCLWGPHLEFVLMENDYRVGLGGAHEILPRGRFTAWYRLGSALTGAPNWICPSINVPRQLAGEDRQRYYELMFLEAYANGGRWGYYWWPGVDPETRRRATAPEVLKEHIAFIDSHRDLYERATSMNDLAIVYLDGPMLARPETHAKYVALAQALAERGYQFDVLFVGDGAFNPDDLDATALQHYRAVLVPEARDLGQRPAAALETYARTGGELVVYSDSGLDPSLVRREDETMLVDFWRGYDDADRERIAATVDRYDGSRIESSDPSVDAIRYAFGDGQLVHLLDYAYEPATDAIRPATDVRISIPWSAGEAAVTAMTLDGETELPSKVDGGRLIVDVPRIDPYAVLLLNQRAM